MHHILHSVSEQNAASRDDHRRDDEQEQTSLGLKNAAILAGPPIRVAIHKPTTGKSANDVSNKARNVDQTILHKSAHSTYTSMAVRTIEGFQLYGGACSTKLLRMLIATTQAKVTA